MQNFQYQYPYQEYNNIPFQDITNKQITRQIMKDCSSACFNVFMIFVIMNFVSIPLIIFSVLPNGNSTGISGMDNISFYLFNSILSFSAFFIFQITYAWVKKIKFNDILQFNKVPPKTMFPLLIAGYSIFTLSNVVASIINESFAIIGIKDTTSLIDMTGNTVSEYILYFIAVAIVPAITEEFAFRGVILTALRKYGDVFAIVSSSILFGFMHGNLVQIPFAFLGGIVLGYIRVYTNSMLPSMLLHFINNSISVILDILNKNIDTNTMNLIYVIFTIVTLLLAIISIIYLASNRQNLFDLKGDTTTEFEFSKKIKLFFANAGMVFTLVAVFITVVLSSDFVG